MLFILISGCENSKTSLPKEILPDEVIRRHIQLLNEKNIDGAESCMIDNTRNKINWDIASLIYIKLISIEQETNKALSESYMKTGRGSIVKPFELKVYNVTIDKKYTQATIESTDNGINIWHYFVIKQNKDSPWLIDDWGI